MDPIQRIIIREILALFHAQKEKPSEIKDFRGFLVAGTGEISNFDLVKDLVKMLEYVNSMDCIRHTEHSPLLISDSFLVQEPSGLPTPEEQKWSDH